MVSIAHWLDTFTCSKYADRFERSGFQSLQSICQLTPAQLQSLGVANNDIYTIMENVSLLKQSLKSLEPPRYLDLNAELPSSTGRSRTASPAINTLNRSMTQNPTSYSPGPHVSTPPASSGPSPDRGLPGPSSFDTPSNPYHRSNSYTNPVNPNTFLDISPSSSTSSPHRSGSMDAYAPPPMDQGMFNEYSAPPPSLPMGQSAPLPPHPHGHPYQPPGMIYRPGAPPPPPPGSAGYYNPHAPRFFAPDHPQQQPQGPPPQYMYSNPRMMMPPQQGPPPPQQQAQHPSWPGHRPAHPPPHPMHYHPSYDQHQYRMPPAQTFHPNHPMMSDQNPMFLNQAPVVPAQPLNPSTSSKLSPSGEAHPHPLQSLERLVLLPESQVIDPKSVVNEIHDPPSPLSESLSPFATSSPKNSVGTPPTTTIVSNLLTNEKSIHDSHAKGLGGLKRGSTYDDRNDLNKKNRATANPEMNTGDSITNNHPVVTSLLTRGLSTNPSQAPLPSIKSLQQKHNPSFLQQQQQQGTPGPPPMMFPPTQPDPQQFVDGLTVNADFDDTEMLSEHNEDYEQLMTELRMTIERRWQATPISKIDWMKIPCQLDGLSEGSAGTTKVTKSNSRKRQRSRSAEGEAETIVSEDQNSSSNVETHAEKSKSDRCESSTNGNEKKSSNGSVDDRRLSENNPELNHSSKSPCSTSTSPKIEKPKVIQSPRPSNLDHDESSSASETIHPQASTTTKPIREAKKRSLIYTGNTREFLETAIAAGLIDANGDEEDEDNEYVPPGGSIEAVRRRRLSSPSSSSSDSDAEEASTKSTNGDDDDDDAEEEGEEEDEQEEEEEVDEEEEVNDENRETEEPSESDITWNVRNRPQRTTHLIRFDNISKQDEQNFFGALQEQAPELAAYLNEDSDEEYQVNSTEPSESTTKAARKSSSKKTPRSQAQESSEQDEQTVEIIKKFRHVRVPSSKSPKKKVHNNESTAISSKNRAHELYVVLNEDSSRTIVSGAQLETNHHGKKSTPVQSFHFQRRPVQMNTVEDPKAPFQCILCWKEPYEDFLGPLFGPYQLNETCQTFLNQNKQLAKHYRKLKEVWFHRDCVLWNNHIQMSPSTGELMHVSEACSTYLDITCSICQQPGAALACRSRNCKVRYHYPCAKTTVNCRLILQSYSVYCPKHDPTMKQKTKKNRRQTATSADDSQDLTTV